MFGFFASEPVVIAEIDASDASFVIEDEVDIIAGSSGAPGLWAGKLWLFTATGPNGVSQASTYKFDAAEAELVIDDLGVVIVGAAVSTCAPYQPEG